MNVTGWRTSWEASVAWVAMNAAGFTGSCCQGARTKRRSVADPESAASGGES